MHGCLLFLELDEILLNFIQLQKKNSACVFLRPCTISQILLRFDESKQTFLKPQKRQVPDSGLSFDAILYIVRCQVSFMCLSSFTFHRWEHSGQKRVPGGTRFFGKLQHPLHKVRHVKFDPIAGKTQFPGLMVSAVNSLSGFTGFIENSFAAISHGRLNMFRVISRTSFGSQMRPVSPRMK